jgi:hypothetical protein
MPQNQLIEREGFRRRIDSRRATTGSQFWAAIDEMRRYPVLAGRAV